MDQGAMEGLRSAEGEEIDVDGADRDGKAERGRAPAPHIFQLEPLAKLELDTKPQWLISGLMPSTGLHVLYGSPGTGKSFVALHASLHVATGRDWAGRRVRQGGVVYVASEGGRNFRKRVVGAREALQVPNDAPFALITRAPNLGGRRHQTVDLIRDIRLQSDIMGFAPKLVILDTLSRSITDLRESDSQDIMEFVEHAQEIADAFDALVMPIHHCGKDESKGMRGSSALHGAADAEWLVSRDAETGVRSISVEKMKDGPDLLKARYDLEDRKLGDDADGEPIVTCVAKVYDVEADAPTVTPKSGKQEDRVLTTLRVLVNLEGLSGTDPGGANVKSVATTRLKSVLSSSGVIGAPTEKAHSTAFNRAMASLAKRSVIARTAERVWLVPVEGSPTEGESSAMREPVSDGCEGAEADPRG